MDNNNQEPQSAEFSKYNDAGLSISRLHEHWLQAEHYANSGKLIKWKFKLDSIWRELFPDILRIKKNNEKEFDEIIKNNKTFKEKIAYSKKQTELYYNLEKRHEFLRMIQDLAGKAGVYVDEDEEGFE